jgi:hypothetical protein
MSDDQGTSSQQVNGGVRFAQNVDLGEKGFVYDPDQNPEEKRQVRRRYRDLNKIGEGARSLHLYVLLFIEMHQRRDKPQ